LEGNLYGVGRWVGDDAETDWVGEVKGLECLLDGGLEVGVGDCAGGDFEGAGEGCLLVVGKGGGIHGGGEVVDVAGNDAADVVDGVGLVVGMEREEDFGVEVAFVGVGLLHLCAGKALGCG